MTETFYNIFIKLAPAKFIHVYEAVIRINAVPVQEKRI